MYCFYNILIQCIKLVKSTPYTHIREIITILINKIKWGSAT